MRNKGFTLVELLAAIVIISLLGGIVMSFSSSFYKSSEDTYYNAIESNVLLAGNDYFSDHRDELPMGGAYSEVSLANLIDAKYIEPVIDTNGVECRNGSVFAYRENNKFKYEVCLVDCGGYNSTGRYCAGTTTREITVAAKTKTSNKKYDVTKSFNATSYAKSENIVVTINMANDYHITKYLIINIKDNSETVCNTSGSNQCVVELNKTGTYKIESYEGNNEISSRYINAKIAKNGSNFTLSTSDGKSKYTLSQTNCSNNVTTKKVKFNITKGKALEEYKSIEYRVNDGEYTELNALTFEKDFTSGHYDIEVIVTNYNDNVSVETLSIDVTYLINIEYDDDTTETHEVVKGQNYNYISPLPTIKVINGKSSEIKWYKGETLINPSTDIVGENCTYKLDGITKISYTLNYSDNLFAARTQSANSVVATYTEDGSYLTLDGAATSKSIISPLWNYERRNISAGDQYKITIKYISGTLTCSDSATCTGSNGKPVFVLELTKNGSNLSNRGTSPYSYKTVALPVSGTNEATFIVDSSKKDADGLKYWLWQNNENVATFSNYKVQIIVTKVHSKNVVYNERYGELDTPEKTGYTFNGWYTSITGGTKVTNTTIYNTEGNQTIYARYTSHKLNLQYNGNDSDVTWCSNSSKYAMDSSKYAIIQSSSTRNIHVVAYGQYMSYTSGLNDYGNKSYLCFSNLGYKVVSGEEWVLSTNSSKKYSQDVKTYTAAGIASDAGCDLKTTATCTAQVNVNWVPNDLIFNNQSISRSFSTSAQTFDLTEASNGTGTYIYTISSQPSGNYFTISAATATIKANTPSGSYEVVIKATDSKSNATKEATYTVTIGSVAATCPTLTAYSGTFDDTSHTIGVSGGSGGTIKYRTSTTGDWTATKPARTTAGTTTVYVMVAGDANHSDKDCGNKTITIDKKAVTITAKAQTINYGGSIATGTEQITSSGLVANHSVTAVTLTASTANATTSGKITPSAATIKNSGGTDRTSSYSITYATGTLTINKVAATCPTLTAYSGTFDDTSYTIGVSGGSGGTIKYRTSTTGDWTATKPTRTTVGTTTVYVMVTGDSNHSDKDCGNKTITIDKKAVTITAKAQTINYGSSIATGVDQVTVSGLISGDSLTAITLTASTTGATTSGKITPSAATIKNASGTDVTSNYNITYATGTLTINKVKAVITCANKTYNGSAQTIATCAGGTISGASQTDYKSGGYSITCAGDSNHTAADAKTCSINQKAVTITAKAQTINYGGSIATGTDQVTTDGLVSGDSLTAITLKASTTNVTTSGTITPSAATTSKGIGNYSVTYKTGVLKINKATGYINLSIANGSIAYGTASAACFTVSSSHGGTISITDDNNTANCSISGNTVTCSNLGSINAGTTIKVTAKSAATTNYTEASKVYTLVVNKATPTFDKTELSKSIYNNNSDTYGLIPNVAGEITSSTSNSGVATVSQASNCSSIGAAAECVITITGKSVGSATITHTFTPNDSNYNSVTTTMPVTIKNSAFTVTFAGVDPIATSFDGQTVTLAGNVGVPLFESSALALSTNTNYVVSFDYKCASGTNQFDVDFFPDPLPQTNPTATTTLQHMDWITSSSNSSMSSAKLRFFDDFQASNESDITISNIMLSRTSTKTVNYGNTYGDLPAPTKTGYTFDGWYTASNGGSLITKDTKVTNAANHTLYARWTRTTCCPNGGSYNGGYCYNTPHDMTDRECSGHGYYMVAGRCYQKRSAAHC